jgi:uncharacterized protein
MNTTQPDFVARGTHDLAKYEPFALGTVQWVRRPGDGGRDDLSCGFWRATPEEAPEPFDVVSEADETVIILEGSVRIQPVDGEAFTLRAGDAASFNNGYRCTWKVLEPTREYFVYS